MAEPKRKGVLDSGPGIERQLAAAQALMHVGSWEWELATNSVRWSDELYRIYGLAPRSCEITFESFLGRVHAGDRERVQRSVGESLERGTTFHHLERIVRPDGSVRQLDSIGEPLRDDAGRICGLIGTCRDVTDERERDEELRRQADIVKNVQIGMSVWCVGDPEDSSKTKLVAFNPAAERVARRSLAGTVGKTLTQIMPFAEGGRFQKLIQDVARDGLVREENVIGSRDQADPTRAISLKAFPLPGACVGVAVEDITERTLGQRAAAVERRVFEMIARGEPLEAVLAALAEGIEEQAPPTIASILLLDADGRRLRTGAAPNLPEAFNRAIDGALVGPGAGSCGAAAAQKRAVIVTDIDTDPLWNDYRDLANVAGVRACTSTPILSAEGRVLGTFALYYRTPRAPSERALSLVERATYIAGIAIERRRMEGELRALSAHIESAREEERTGIAREIHDELGQALTALKMDLAWIRRRARSDSPLDAETLTAKIDETTTATDRIIDTVRRISSELRPGVLDDLGLGAALEWQSQDFQRRSGVVCSVRAAAFSPEQLDQSASTAVFRVFQETLTNVARHAEASRVDARLEAADGWLELEVSDDGKGIAPEAAASPKSLGLIGIRERALRLGGSASVGRRPEGGTAILFRVPLRAGPA
jgi:PAS domain S-box-containing protein